MRRYDQDDVEALRGVFADPYAAIAYSARSRTPFRCDGGQHSAVMADTVPG
jgi:hypothetical protein